MAWDWDRLAPRRLARDTEPSLALTLRSVAGGAPSPGLMGAGMPGWVTSRGTEPWVLGLVVSAIQTVGQAPQCPEEQGVPQTPALSLASGPGLAPSAAPDRWPLFLKCWSQSPQTRPRTPPGPSCRLSRLVLPTPGACAPPWEGWWRSPQAAGAAGGPESRSCPSPAE